MNRQEVLDTVSAHLLTQGVKAQSDDGQCVYRSSEGYKCAIGCLIADEHYNKDIEGHTIVSETVVEVLRKSGIDSSGAGDNKFLRSLQNVHDNYSPENWRNALKEVAERYGLMYIKQAV